MGRTVAELEQTLSSAELSEWMAFNSVDPLPDPYWTSAQICMVIANCMSTRKFTLSDFLPRTARPTATRLTPEQSRTMLRDRIGTR